MFKNYLITLIRGILKNKKFFVINLIGLVAAFSAFLILILYCSYELNFDNFHNEGKNKYRLITKIFRDGKLVSENATTPPPLNKIIKNNLPEIKTITSFTVPMNEQQYVYNGNIYDLYNIWCDSSFFNFFSFPIIAGDYINPLGQNAFLISERFAKKCFKNHNPIGKELTMLEHGSKTSKIITGVFKIPENTHLSFDIASPINDDGFTKNAFNNGWNYPMAYAYLNVDNHADIGLLENKILNTFNAERGEKIKKRGEKYEFKLQRIDQIHLKSALFREPTVNGSFKNVIILICVAYFIMLICWLSYNNIVTSMALERAKEITIRKVIGAKRFVIIIQSLVETFCFNLIAIILSVLFILTLNLFYNFSQLTDSNMFYDIIHNQLFWAVSILTLIIGSMLSGLYPAIRISSFDTKDILHGKFSHSSKGKIIKNFFLTFQIFVSISLLIITGVISNQLSFMKNYNKGFDGKNVIVLENPISTNEISTSSKASFKDKLLQYSFVRSVSVTTDFPGKPIKFRENVSLDSIQTMSFDVIFSDVDYFDLFKFKALSGRIFSKNFTSDLEQVLINETAANMLGFDNYKDAIGKKLLVRGKWREILGVLKNHNHLSLNQKIGPIVYINRGNNYHFYLVSLNKGNLENNIKVINGLWDELFPGAIMHYKFLDDIYNAQYKSEDIFLKLLMYFSAVLLCLTCIGLMGLALFETTLKRKEIGIKKMLGASIMNVTFFQLKKYFIVFGIALSLALCPVYMICSSWLQQFPYRFNFGPIHFILPSLAVLIIILITVLYNTLKTSFANPIESLKSE